MKEFVVTWGADPAQYKYAIAQAPSLAEVLAQFGPTATATQVGAAA